MESLSLVKEGPRKEDIEAAGHRVEQARAAIKTAEERLKDTVITAPAPGVVLRKNVELGETVAAGVPIFTMGDLSSPWIKVYVPEPQLTLVKLGQRAHVTVDTEPNRPKKIYDGWVSYISNEAEFTPKSVQTQEERVKLVFGVKVRVENPNQELKPSMPADVRILLKGPGTNGARDRPFQASSGAPPRLASLVGPLPDARIGVYMGAIAIKTSGLTKSFGRTKAVDHLDLEVVQGELFGLVGPDGAGKSTTMRLLTGIMRPTSGNAWVAGHPIPGEEELIKERIGYMSQRFGLYEDLTVMENILFYADLYGVPQKDRPPRIERLLGFSNLSPFQDAHGGQPVRGDEAEAWARLCPYPYPGNPLSRRAYRRRRPCVEARFLEDTLRPAEGGRHYSRFNGLSRRGGAMHENRAHE